MPTYCSCHPTAPALLLLLPSYCSCPPTAPGLLLLLHSFSVLQVKEDKERLKADVTELRNISNKLQEDIGQVSLKFG